MIGNFIFGVIALGANVAIWGGFGAFIGFIFASLRRMQPLKGLLIGSYMLLTISGPGWLLGMFSNWMHKSAWVFTPWAFSALAPLAMGFMVATVIYEDEKS